MAANRWFAHCAVQLHSFGILPSESLRDKMSSVVPILRRGKRTWSGSHSMMIDRFPPSRGIWTEFKGDRGTMSKPIAGPHLVYGFLTTSPNAIVEPIHPKAMPMILTTRRGARHLAARAVGRGERCCSRRCRMLR
jgi:hypothetical protein